MKDILNKIAAQSRFTIDIFSGQVKVQGRILSPQESEALGLTSGMIASQLFPDRAKARMKEWTKLAEQAENGEQNVDEILNAIKDIRPEQLLKISEHQDRIISKVIKSASSDDGETWEPLQIVLSETEQDPDKGRLWVGLLSSQDRRAIIDKAMQGHKEAAEALASF